MQGVNISQTGLLADLARINIKYLLEHYNQGSLQTALALPLPPKSFSIIQEAPSQVTYTLGGGVVRELSGYKPRIITLLGSSGYDARRGYNREGGIVFEKGSVILREFRAFLEEYQEKADSLKTQENQLIFRAIDEDYHLKVEVVSFEIQRDSEGAHFAPNWILTLRAYEEADRVRSFNSIQESIDDISQSISLCNSALASISSTIEGGVGLANLVLSPLDDLKTSVQAFGSIAESLRTVLDLPSDIVGRLEQTALALRTPLTRLVNDVERFPNAFSSRIKSLQTAIFGAEEIQALSESLSTYAPPLSEENLDHPSLYLTRGANLNSQMLRRQNHQTYRLRLEEDLVILARRYLGDGERWLELAEINGWVDPYRLSNGRTAETGDVVLIPIDREDQLNLSFGEDLLLNNEGELVVTNNDLVTVEGARNLEQGLKLRLKAVQEETPIFINYGLPKMVGRRLNSSLAGYLGAIIQAQLNRDSRVERILLIEMKDHGDTLQAQIELRANEINNLGVNISI